MSFSPRGCGAEGPVAGTFAGFLRNEIYCSIRGQMDIQKIIFNPGNERFRKPPGAIKSGEILKLRLYVGIDLEPRSVKVVFRYDRHTQPAVYEMEGTERTSGGQYVAWEGAFPVFDTGLYWYYFIVDTPAGEISFGPEGTGNPRDSWNQGSWQQTVYKRKYDVPQWLQGGVIYQIFVDRFCRSSECQELEKRLYIKPTAGSPARKLHWNWSDMPDYKPQNGQIMNNDFFGGDLKGIESKLDYLQDLGVTCLYLSPIFRAYSNHKYDTADYMEVDPLFGTGEDFRELCEKAEEKGIRIILDGVFAHTGSDSVYFDKEERYGGGALHHEDSKYRDWYIFTGTGHGGPGYETWWGISTLPKLNKNNRAFRNFICGPDGVARRWLRAGASGWRLDVADELPSDFLRLLTEAVKEEKPDGLVLGEVWEDASSKEAYGQRKNYFEGDKLDSVTNYPFKNGIIQLVRNGDPGELSEKVSTLCQNYPPEVMNCTMNILDSHDTTRILTALAGEIPPNEGDRDWMASAHLSPEEMERGRNLLKIASAIQMTLPGVPCIYYGDERGMEGYSDPFNRATVNWDKADQNLLEWYKKIISIRKNHQVYVSGKCETVAESAGLYAFRRFFPDNDEPENNQQSGIREALGKTSEAGNRRSVITAANCGQSLESMSLTGRWKDLITGKVLTGRTDVLPGEILILEEQPETLGTDIKKTGPRKISNYCHI